MSDDYVTRADFERFANELMAATGASLHEFRMRLDGAANVQDRHIKEIAATVELGLPSGNYWMKMGNPVEFSEFIRQFPDIIHTLTSNGCAYYSNQRLIAACSPAGDFVLQGDLAANQAYNRVMLAHSEKSNG